MIQSFCARISWGFTSRLPHGIVFDCAIIDRRPGFIVLKVSGKKADKLFEGEAGGHRWQRVPPTEKRGRVQTSTITVAVLPEPKYHEVQIDSKDLKERFTCGSGSGGQHRNRNATAVQLTHIPSGLSVRAESEKSQKQNRENALALLKAKLLEIKRKKAKKDRFKMRQEQVGTGMRGDKIRTIRVRHNQVVDHASGKQITYKDYARGKLWGLKQG